MCGVHYTRNLWAAHRGRSTSRYTESEKRFFILSRIALLIHLGPEHVQS
jgi:hypothetical protein